MAVAAVAASPLLPRLPKKKLGVALLGLGSYATHQLAPALQQTRYCHLTGIVTGSPWKIPQWQQQYGIRGKNIYNYGNMSRLADNDNIDVVYIVVPTGLHARYAIEAANAGKHVWCEKPMAMNTEECRAIMEACERNGVRLSIGYRMQHEPNTQLLMSWAFTRPYGRQQSVRALAGYAGGGGTGWRFQAEMGGGALYDMGVYSINGLRYATGKEPLRVLSARQWTDRPEIFTEVDEHTEFELEFADGLTGYGRTSVGQSINLLRVEAADGWYELSPMQAYNGVQGKASDGFLLNETIASQQARQMDDDARAILEGRPLLVPGEEGMRDIRLVHAIRDSAATGRPVDLS